MVKIYLTVVLGTILSFFADVAPWGGCCGGGTPKREIPQDEPPADSRLHKTTPTRLVAALVIQNKTLAHPAKQAQRS
ncbi:hypothetical protein L6R29_00770 [Myxococcota bacterium]|nr:hypothetical protein [Myxococcota bacterium]